MSTKKIQGIYLFLLLIILSTAGFLRLYKLGESSYWIDEGFTLMQTKAVLKHGYPLLNSGAVDFKDFLLPYLLSPIAHYTDSPFFFRLIPAIFGILSIYIIYLLGKNLFNQKIGLISSFFLAFSYWHIAWSRQIRGYAPLVFFLLLSVLTITLFEHNHKKKYLLMAFATIILATFAKTSGILLFIPFVFYLLMKKLNREAFLVIFIFSFLALILRQYFFNAFNLSFVNYLGFYSVGYLWKYFGVLLPLALASFYLVSKKNYPVHLFNFLCFFVPLIYFSFFCYISEKRYLFLITPFIFLYGAFVLNYISQYSRKKLFIFLFFILFIDRLSIQTFIFKPQTFYSLEKYTPQPNFSSAYQKINADKKQNYYMISAYPYMDLIYLNKSDFYLPISYTGRESDNIKSTKEHYSGTNRLIDEEKLKQLRKKGDIYFIFDEMATERVDGKIQKYIKQNSQLIFNDYSPQQILVYKISQNSY